MSKKSQPAGEQFAALGIDPADYTPAMTLAIKQRWSNLPVDKKVDELRAELAAVQTPAVTSVDALIQELGTRELAEAEHRRLKRNAAVNAWRVRNQLRAALDARDLKFAAMRAKRAPKAPAEQSHAVAV